MKMACLDLCSGAGGQALGLERAGFDIVGAVERNSNAAKTLTANRPQWTIHNDDVRSTSWRAGYAGIDLVAAGAPCTPFTPAGRRRGREDARDLLHEVIDVVEQLRPRLVMIENVPALMSPRFAKYRSGLFARLEHLGFSTTSYLLTATDFGVAQRRKRWILVGSAEAHTSLLTCQVETTSESECRSVGETLADLMSERGWRGVGRWAQRASGPAPTITGGSELHGGPDLGPSRSRVAWTRLGVDPRSIADDPPSQYDSEFHVPRLTLRMLARLQDFPDSWRFCGGKTAAFRQIGNALPAAVGAAVGRVLAGSVAQTRL